MILQLTYIKIMAFPTSEQELRAGLDQMKAQGASPEELKIVIDEFVKRQRGPVDTKKPVEPSKLEKGISKVLGATPLGKPAQAAFDIAQQAGGLPGVLKGAAEGFREGAEGVGTRKGVIAEMPIDTLGQKLTKGAAQLGNIPLSGAEMITDTVGGAIAPVVAPVLKKGYEALPEPAQEKLGEVADDFNNWFVQLSPGKQEAIKAAGIAAEFIPGEKVLSTGGKTLAKEVGGVAKSIADDIPGLTERGVKFVQAASKEAGPAIKTAKDARLVKKRTNELSSIVQNNAPLRKKVAKAEQEGFDVVSEIAQTDLLKGAVDSDGTIRTATAIDQLNESIAPAEDVIAANLRQSGEMLPMDVVANKLKQDIMNSGLKGGALKRALANAADDIDGYMLEAVDELGNPWNPEASTGKPLLPLATIHDAKVDKYSNINYLNPDVKKADKTIARGLKELVEENAKDLDVKAINQELKKFYTIQDVLETLDGRKVKGGRLGKYTAQTIGAVAGSGLGPLGTVLGAELGGIIRGIGLKRTFQGTTGKSITRSPMLEEAITRGQSNNLGSRNINQSTTTSPVRKPINEELQVESISETVDESSPGFKQAGAAESAIQQQAQQYIVDAKSKGGTLVIDSDRVKETMPGYTPDRAPEFHEESSRIATRAYQDALQDPEYTNVELMAGGSGSGKSEVYVNANLNKADTILFDGTLADINKARSKIDEAIAAGKEVSIKAVYAPIKDAWEFASKRERNVPKNVFIEKHRGFRDTVADLAREYPAVKIDVYFNAKGSPAAHPLRFATTQDLLRYLDSQRLSAADVSDFTD